MRKALIIASCGLILALVIGATSQSKPAAPAPESQHFIKCHESHDEIPRVPECASYQVRKSQMLTEKFLRGIKYKSRKVFA